MNEQIIRLDYPPLIDKLEEVFGPLKGKPILYAWGDIVYNPSGYAVSQPLRIHEAIHGIRQWDFPVDMSAGHDPDAHIEAWWVKYMADPEFRLHEEVLAHQAEYKAFTELHRDRNARDAYLRKVAQKLASPLYGRLVPYNVALKIVKEVAGGPR